MKLQDQLSPRRSISTREVMVRTNSTTHLRSHSSLPTSQLQREYSFSISHHQLILPNNNHSTISTITFSSKSISSLFHSLTNLFYFPSLKSLSFSLPHLSFSPARCHVIGTLFGFRHGHVTLAIQLDPRSKPVLLLELDMSTLSLIRQMSIGLIRIALECERVPGDGRGRTKLLHEPRWTMNCGGRKCGYAISHTCGGFDWYVLNTVQNVSVGAGVIPVLEDGRKRGSCSEGELLFMRARYERVVGSRDSEAFYMMNPDGYGGPELSIFLLRV